MGEVRNQGTTPQPIPMQDVIVVSRLPRRPSTRSVSRSSGSSSSLTPAPEILIHPMRGKPVYTDKVPSDAKFWIEINPPKPDFNRELYDIDEEEFNVVGIFDDSGEDDDKIFEVQFEDDHIATIPLAKLLSYNNGRNALQEYQSYARRSKRKRKSQLVSDSDLSDDELSLPNPQIDSRNKRRRTLQILSQKASSSRPRHTVSTRSGRMISLTNGYREDESDLTDIPFRQGTRKSSRTIKSRSSLRYDLSDFEDDFDESDAPSRTSRTSVKPPRPKKAVDYYHTPDLDGEFAQRHQYLCMFSNDLTIIDDDDGKDYAMCQGCSFMFHVECLGDKTKYRAISLLERNQKRLCVLQCGRCSGSGKNGKNTTRCIHCGLVGDRCEEFKHPEKIEEKTENGDEVKDEDEVIISSDMRGKAMKEWNDASKVLFRCMACERAWHFDHLPPLKEQFAEHEVNDTTNGLVVQEGPSTQPNGDIMELDGTTAPNSTIDDTQPSKSVKDTANKSLEVNGVTKKPSQDEVIKCYTEGHWKCTECRRYHNKKVEVILGWRPTQSTLSQVPDDFKKEYLVKFEDQSYHRVLWVPATWLSGVSFAMKQNFDQKELSAIESSTDVVSELWLRVDMIFDVEYEDGISRQEMKFRSHGEELKALSKVTRALCKWQQLKYEDTTWEVPPSEDSPRYPAFKGAYEEYVGGEWTTKPNYRGQKYPYADLTKAEDVIQAEFGHRLEMKEQPEWLERGKMFDYQLEGMNWLYFQWFKRTSAILADEMGLGKTIQIIAMISTIFKKHHRWPFLVVAPNSTLENWRREFQKWAPSLRVVAWPGTADARDLVKNYQLTRPGKNSDLKAHVVVTGYGTARTTVSFLRRFDWECLIVDEGQALKNDKSELFQELCSLRVQHRVILTGTPLQNNIRELFNILQFLDSSQFNAEELETKYEELDEERVREIHAMLRPRFLRRTKADVLTSLPSKSELIIPLSMPSVQRELYKSIVSQNPELLKAITTRFEKGQKQLKSNLPKLQNILMQLRKCLAHPFVQSPELEDRNVDSEQEQRALTEASGKLSFLAKILPKLKERGHRILIFSQFLDMLDIIEDFLTGIGFRFRRLDGSTATVERQHMIDEFNAPDSSIDCFLLSTRAGGAGINLATADTVIIYDPDHNPHQDLQALARAHRIGQEKKVLVFRLMTRNTVEERIYQSSRKKMVLDHLIVESLDNNEEKLDVEALILHGLKALFEDTGEKDIKYDDADIEKLLDRSQMEETVDSKPSDEASLGSFKMARIWANSTAQIEDLAEESDAHLEVGYWDRIIQERMSLAQAQKLAAIEEAGRGKRRAQKIDYAKFNTTPEHLRTIDLLNHAVEEIESDVESAIETITSRVDDKDFQAGDVSNDHSDEDEGTDIEAAELKLLSDAQKKSKSQYAQDDADEMWMNEKRRYPDMAWRVQQSQMSSSNKTPSKEILVQIAHQMINHAIKSNLLPGGSQQLQRKITSPISRLLPPDIPGLPNENPLIPDHIQTQLPRNQKFQQPAQQTQAPPYQLFPSSNSDRSLPWPPLNRSPHSPRDARSFPWDKPPPTSPTPTKIFDQLVLDKKTDRTSPNQGTEHKAEKGAKALLELNKVQRSPARKCDTSNLPLLPIPRDPIKWDVSPALLAEEATCGLCGREHDLGECPLRDIDPERCPGCGYHHLHITRACPLLRNKDYVRMMKTRLKESTEDKALVRAASRYLGGVLADYNLRESERRIRAAESKQSVKKES